MSAVPLFCNACFQRPPSAAALPAFSLTSCGHVLCPRCLQRGKQDECVVCRASCRTIVLSKKMDSNIQSLFMGMDVLCKKYSKEVTQIAQFQENHRRRLLAHYRKKIAELEGYCKKATQQMQHMQRLQQVPSMEVDHVPVSVRKTETVAGPTRISLISPAQNGHIGSVSYRSSQLSGITSCSNNTSASVRPSPLRTPNTGNSYMSSFGSSQHSKTRIPDTCVWRTAECTPSRSLMPKRPISLASLLQRQHLEPNVQDIHYKNK